MVSSRSWKNSNFNRVMSLALCVGVAFLLLAGSAFAQGTTALVSNPNLVALQVGKANTQYTIAATYGTFSRTMGVARQVASGNFFVTATLPAGFTFVNNIAGGELTLPGATNGGGAITVPPSIFSGGTAGSNYVKYQVEVTTSFVTAPTFQLATAGWVVKDSLGTLSGTSPVTVQLTITTSDANTGTPIDTGGTDAANFINAVNGISATTNASAAVTTAIIDTAANSGRKNFVATAPDTIVQDNGINATVTIGSLLANPVKNAGGAAYQIAAADKIRLTVTGALTGVKFIYFNTGGGAAEVKYTVVAADRTNGFAVIDMPGSNAAISALANASSAAIPITIETDGTTQLSTRNFTLGLTTVINNNAACNSTLVSPVQAWSWGINGTVLMANWASANTSAFRSRIYLFNSTATDNATVIFRIFQLPISANSTQGVQVGNAVTLDKPLNSGTGMTIRLEDVLTASGATDEQKQGPDGAFNVAVEVTVYAQGTGLMNNGGVTGYTQTMNTSFTMSFGTTPLIKVQPLP